MVFVSSDLDYQFFFFFSSRRRHTRCALVTGVQTCALPICHLYGKIVQPFGGGGLIRVGPKLARGDQRAILVEHRLHLRLDAFLITPVKLTAISPSCSIRPRMKIIRRVSRRTSTTASSVRPSFAGARNWTDASIVTPPAASSMPSAIGPANSA